MGNPFVPGDLRIPDHPYFQKQYGVKQPRWDQTMRHFAGDAVFHPDMPGQGGAGSPNPAWSNVIFLGSFAQLSPYTEESDFTSLTLNSQAVTLDATTPILGQDSTNPNNSTAYYNSSGNFYEMVSGDYSIEANLYVPNEAITGNPLIAGIYATLPVENGRNWLFRLDDDSGTNTGTPNALFMTIFPNGGSAAGYILMSGPAVVKGQVNHLAWKRIGNKHLCYTEGVPGTPLDSAVRPSGGGALDLQFFRNPNGNFQMPNTFRMGEFRITQTEDYLPDEGFTPPTTPYPRGEPLLAEDSDTLLDETSAILLEE